MKEVVNSKLGEIEIIINEGMVWEVNFVDQGYKNKDKIRFKNLSKDKEVLKNTIKEIKEYLNGERKKFDLPIDWEGTEFQARVWKIISQIPYGQTMTYKEIAQELGNDKAYRAVANACSANRVSIIIPCHRVVSANGGLGGYRGGLWRKKWLLDWEKSLI